MKQLLFILLSALSFRLLAAEPDAVFLNIEKTYLLNQDGSIEYHYTHNLKILSYFAIHRKYGETIILYNPKYQKVRINDVYTILENGKKITLPANAVNEVLPNEAIDAPAYNHLRKMVITHTGLELNCIIHIDYTLITQKGYYPCLMGNERLQQSSPAENLTVRVIVPESTDLKYDLLNISNQPEITQDNGNRQYQWIFTRLPAFSEEPDQPAPQLFEPFLLFTSKDMKLIYNEFLNQPAFSFYLSENARQWALKLKEQSKDENEFIEKIHQYIVHYVRTYPLPLPLTGYKIQTPDEVFQHCGGTKLEKLCLMNALIQSVGIKATIKLIAPGLDKALNSLNLDAFTDVLLDVTDRTTDQITTKTYFADVANEISLNQQYHRISYCTILPLFVGMSTYDPESYKDHIKISIQKVITYEIDHNGNIYQKSKPDKIVSAPVQDTVLIINKIPWSGSGLEDWHVFPLVEERSAPVLLPCISSDERKLILKLHDQLRPAQKKISYYIENQTGSFKYFQYRKGKKIYIERTVRFNQQIVSPADYQNLKEILSAYKSETYNTIYLEKPIK